MAAPIEFFFDFASPYAYFAAHRIDAIGAKHGREVEWRPFMLGAAFKATGMMPLTEQPLRGDYAKHDWNRLARRMEIPFVLPERFPIVTLAAGRAYYWLAAADKPLARKFALRMFQAYFGQGRDITAPEAVAAEAAPLGIAAAELVAATGDGVWKAKLKEATDEALRRGAFGSPFTFVDGEPFWGNDRLDMVDDWLSAGGW